MSEALKSNTGLFKLNLMSKDNKRETQKASTDKSLFSFNN